AMDFADPTIYTIFAMSNLYRYEPIQSMRFDRARMEFNPFKGQRPHVSSLPRFDGIRQQGVCSVGFG
ncbi:hypothetical protein, partial [Paramuribaculum intestinale]|uniref:hypothetical protein n=1 Tax=Paramuribaculum intestinale TaxID=2094151 RepID=UPI0025B0EC69